MGDAELVRNEGLDKFYTKKSVAKDCIDFVERLYPDSFHLIVEPSAGNGSFFHQISGNKVGIDISPENGDIKEMDFFNYIPEENCGKILVIGNPPFGKCSSLAVKFFNHACEWCDVIAFIVPRTFKRVSIQNRLNLNFKLVFNVDLPTKPCCFDVPIAVKCCFQIWERSGEKRQKVIQEGTHSHFYFVDIVRKEDSIFPPTNCDFALRAYGGKCGEIVLDVKDLRPKSWHFIKNSGIISLEELIRNFKSLDYSISLDTARQNSIGRRDLVEIYNLKNNL